MSNLFQKLMLYSLVMSCAGSGLVHGAESTNGSYFGNLWRWTKENRVAAAVIGGLTATAGVTTGLYWQQRNRARILQADLKARPTMRQLEEAQAETHAVQLQVFNVRHATTLVEFANGYSRGVEDRQRTVDIASANDRAAAERLLQQKNLEIAQKEAELQELRRLGNANSTQLSANAAEVARLKEQLSQCQREEYARALIIVRQESEAEFLSRSSQTSQEHQAQVADLTRRLQQSKKMLAKRDWSLVRQSVTFKSLVADSHKTIDALQTKLEKERETFAQEHQRAIEELNAQHAADRESAVQEALRKERAAQRLSPRAAGGNTSALVGLRNEVAQLKQAMEPVERERRSHADTLQKLQSAESRIGRINVELAAARAELVGMTQERNQLNERLSALTTIAES